MKIAQSISILLAFCSAAYGQQTILVTKDREDYYEEYTVLQSDRKIKHGSYLKLRKSFLGEYFLESVGTYTNGAKNGYWETYYPLSNNIMDKGFYRNDLKDSIWISFYPEGTMRKLAEVESEGKTSLQVVNANPTVLKAGRYSNGKLVGIWEYFNEQGLINQKFDHDNGLLIFMNNADLNNIDAGFIGGEFLMTQYLYNNFDFDGLMNSVNNKISLQSGKVVFSFTIDENGKLINIKELENSINSKKIHARAMETTQSLIGMWYPSRKNGIAETTTKTITYNLGINSNYESSITEKWIFGKTIKELKVNIKLE